MHSFPLICLWFIYQNVSNSKELWNNTRRYEILHTLNLDCSFITLRERAVINNLDVILYGFMLQIIYTTVFPVERFNNLKLSVRLFNCFTRKCGIIDIHYKTKTDYKLLNIFKGYVRTSISNYHLFLICIPFLSNV